MVFSYKANSLQKVATLGCNFFSIQPILIQIGMLGVVSVLKPYLISNIKIQNGDHLAEISSENTKNGKSQL